MRPALDPSQLVSYQQRWFLARSSVRATFSKWTPTFQPWNASGRFHKVSDIRLQLHREGYNYELVQGPVLAKQLVEAMEKAHQREDKGARYPKKGSAKKPIKVVPKKKR